MTTHEPLGLGRDLSRRLIHRQQQLALLRRGITRSATSGTRDSVNEEPFIASLAFAKRAVKSTAPSTNAAERSARRPNLPPLTNAASTAQVVRRHLASPVCIMATSIVTRSVSLLLTSASNRNTPISAFSALARSVILFFYESLHKMYDASVHISNINSLFGLSDVLFESKSSVEDDPRKRRARPTKRIAPFTVPNQVAPPICLLRVSL
ncbi:Uncharacterized protein APZ42_021157 [Daphnia magna]|uniref:Uncharacterized protein n=1 Tax=Daphnia magna TaxID=35525 RepID=A0A164X138_9CRUS|nr:Uncharacterized protein APZ42_021157 [Daphnia magna]